LKCNKFIFHRGSSTPDPAGGVHNAPSDPLGDWGGVPLPIPYQFDANIANICIRGPQVREITGRKVTIDEQIIISHSSRYLSF